MPGVDILAVEEVAVEFALNWTVFWIILGAVIVGTLIYTITKVVSGEYSWTLIPALLVTFSIFGAAFGLISANALKEPTKYEYQYKITVSNDVSMNDFMERYEIIDTEGKIYIVREREMNED